LNEREKLKARDYDQVRQVVLESKEKAKQEAERIKKLIEEKKRREAQEVRKQRLENEEKIIQAKNQHIQAQKVRSLKVKQAESSSALKIKEYHSVKAELLREEREKMVREEEERILQKEREVQKLSMREDAMLEALYKAQDSENTALTEYEEISKLPLDEVASKYTYYLKTDNGGLSSKKWPSDTSPRGKSMSFVSGSFIQPKSAKLLPLTLKSQEVMKQSYLSN